MDYNGTVYRPPIEANTFLIPITEGCTHNSCTFCNMYKDVRFRMIPLQNVKEYLDEVRRIYGERLAHITRVYLVAADPFALSAKCLLERIALIEEYIPNLQVVTMYARIDNIAHKSDEDLQELAKAHVDDLYIGVECALDDVLCGLNKGNTSEEARKQCLRLNDAGIQHCDLLMLGTAGKGRWHESAVASAAFENEVKPHRILVTTMSAFAGTKLDDDIAKGIFTQASERENLKEERELLSLLDLPECFFWVVHPLDSTKIEGVLGRDKQRMLDALTRSIESMDEDSTRRASLTGTL